MASPQPQPTGTNPESTLSLSPTLAFSDEEAAENERVFAELVTLVRTREAIVMVGAGSSISAGYSSWGGLLSELRKRAMDISPPFEPGGEPASARELLELAQRIRDHVNTYGGQSAFHDMLGRELSRTEENIRRSLTRFHLDLVHLPFRAFLTTNYDPVLEIAFETQFRDSPRPIGVAVWNGDRQRLGPAIRSLAVEGPTRFILHLHGLLELSASVILCQDEYAKAYGIPDLAPPSQNSERLPRYWPPTHLFLLLASLLATRRVVFVGFSLEDYYFTDVLGRVSTMLWEWERSVHFALLPISAPSARETRQRAARLKKDLGIEAVFYESDGRDHSQRDRIIARLREEVAPSQEPETEATFLPDAGITAATTASVAPQAVSLGNQDPSRPSSTPPNLGSNDRTLDWVRATNAAQRARAERLEEP